MSIFSGLAQLSSNIVDAVMSEQLRFVPMKPGRNRAGGVDPDRAARNVVGVYREIAHRTNFDTSHTGKALDQQAQAPVISLSVDAALIARDEYRQGDRVIRLDEIGHPEFEITAGPEFDGRTRYKFTLIRLVSS